MGKMLLSSRRINFRGTFYNEVHAFNVTTQIMAGSCMLALMAISSSLAPQIDEE